MVLRRLVRYPWIYIWGFVGAWGWIRSAVPCRAVQCSAVQCSGENSSRANSRGFHGCEVWFVSGRMAWLLLREDGFGDGQFGGRDGDSKAWGGRWMRGALSVLVGLLGCGGEMSIYDVWSRYRELSCPPRYSRHDLARPCVSAAGEPGWGCVVPGSTDAWRGRRLGGREGGGG